MGTIDLSGCPLPELFEPKETTIKIGYNYNLEVFKKCKLNLLLVNYKQFNMIMKKY